MHPLHPKEAHNKSGTYPGKGGEVWAGRTSGGVSVVVHENNATVRRVVISADAARGLARDLLAAAGEPPRG